MLIQTVPKPKPVGKRPLYKFALCSIQPVQNLKDETDFTFRRFKKQWWLQMRSMMKILARHDSTYMSESELVGVDEAAAEL